MEKAINSITASPSRRNFIASGVAMASLLPVAISKASAAVPSLSSEFAAKCQRYRELRAALDSLYEANHIKLERLEHPELPGALLEPLELPGIGKKTPDENGWCKSELERLAKQGYWEVNVINPKAGIMTVKSGFRPVCLSTKERAAELLSVRETYDAAVKKWQLKTRRIENSTRRPMNKMDNALLEAMEHQATHAGDLLQKIQLAKEADLFEDFDYPMEKTTIECLFRDIQHLAMQA